MIERFKKAAEWASRKSEGAALLALGLLVGALAATTIFIIS